jgi:hypothetical protein
LVATAAMGQTTPSRSGEVDLGRIFAAVPEAFLSALGKGHTELFRLVETLELLHFENEIDRFVGNPRTLHDSTTYKLSLLPFQIRYPIYRQLVAQMTRLDTVRSRRIHMVTPDSVSLIDLKIQPFATLDAMVGEGAGREVQNSLLTHFSAREIADLSVFLLAQQSFFPQTDEDWLVAKRRIARASVPIALGALATGAAFDAGALGHSGTIVRSGDDLSLRYYAGFRRLGVNLRPYLRGGLAVSAFKLEAALGLADQVRPAANEPDRAIEAALREGWLNQLGRPLGLDAFVEVALKRSIQEPAGFTGDRTTTRAGFFFKREQLPALPSLTLRGSAEAESDLRQRLHLVGAIGVERPRSGIATVLQASLVPAPPLSEVPDDARLSLFLVGTTEPITASFAEDMSGLARLCDTEWTALEEVDRQREQWEQALVARGTASRTPEEARAMLAEAERILAEREDRLLRLASSLAEYLESRRRAYSVLGWEASPDNLHGPLDAVTLVAARDRILTRLQSLSSELATTLTPLQLMRKRMTALKDEIEHLESTEPDGTAVAVRRHSLAALEQQWDLDTERTRRHLAARDQLRAEGIRILEATGGNERSIRAWDTLGDLVRTRIARLAFSSAP